nr:MAG TPA: hypothetical protein [Caudoviricetes sp.]
MPASSSRAILSFFICHSCVLGGMTPTKHRPCRVWFLLRRARFVFFCLAHLNGNALRDEPFAGGIGCVHNITDRKAAVVVGEGFDGTDFHDLPLMVTVNGLV